MKANQIKRDAIKAARWPLDGRYNRDNNIYKIGDIKIVSCW